MKSQISEAEKELSVEMAKSPQVRLTDLLHKIECRSSHVDQCGWDYETDVDYTKSGTTRNYYYARSVKILTNEDIDNVVRIISKYADTR